MCRNAVSEVMQQYAAYVQHRYASQICDSDMQCRYAIQKRNSNMRFRYVTSSSSLLSANTSKNHPYNYKTKLLLEEEENDPASPLSQHGEVVRTFLQVMKICLSAKQIDKNIHLKDRIKHGATVRFGFGNANFKKMFVYFDLCSSCLYEDDFKLPCIFSPQLRI